MSILDKIKEQFNEDNNKYQNYHTFFSMKSGDTELPLKSRVCFADAMAWLYPRRWSQDNDNKTIKTSEYNIVLYKSESNKKYYYHKVVVTREEIELWLNELQQYYNDKVALEYSITNETAKSIELYLKITGTFVHHLFALTSIRLFYEYPQNIAYCWFLASKDMDCFKGISVFNLVMQWIGVQNLINNLSPGHALVTCTWAYGGKGIKMFPSIMTKEEIEQSLMCANTVSAVCKRRDIPDIAKADLNFPTNLIDAIDDKDFFNSACEFIVKNLNKNEFN